MVVKEIFADLFEDKFKPINTFIPSAPNPLFKQLSATNQALLEASVTQEEIKEAVWSCSGDKHSSSLRGTCTLYTIMYRNFFDTGIIPRGCNAFFITLIPKIKIHWCSNTIFQSHCSVFNIKF